MKNTTLSVCENCKAFSLLQFILVGLQLRTALRAQFAESCVHAQESIKNHQPENLLIGDYHTDGEENR